LVDNLDAIGRDAMLKLADPRFPFLIPHLGKASLQRHPHG
jgi:hypothetical protein